MEERRQSATEPLRTSDAQREVAAFYALPRSALYLGAVVVIGGIAALLGTSALFMSLGRGALSIPLYPLSGLVVTAWLLRSLAGRGCLRELGLNRFHRLSKLEPATQLRVWGVMTLLAAVFVYGGAAMALLPSGT